MRYEKWDTGGRDYTAIAAAAADPATKPTEVSRAYYWDMLECLPPIYVPGGFLVCEPLTGNVYAMLAKRGDEDLGTAKYYAKNVVRGNRETYIPDVVIDAYEADPLDPNEENDLS